MRVFSRLCASARQIRRDWRCAAAVHGWLETRLATLQSTPPQPRRFGGADTRREISCDAATASTPYWAAAGLAALLAQGVDRALTQEEGVAPQPTPVVGNKSTAQWRLYTNLGNEHFRKGDRAKAERYFVRALEEARQGFGEDDGHVAAASNNLAELYRNTGRPELAEPLYREAIRILEVVYGDKDPRFATGLQHLAGFYQQQMRWSLARRHFAQAMQALEAAFGDQHPMYARALLRLADIERMTDNKEAAIALMRRVVDILDADASVSSSERLVAVNKLGQLLVMDGQHEAGLAVLRRCTQQAEEAFTGDSPEVSGLLPFYLASLADALRRCGMLEEARETLHRALSLRSGRGAHAASLMQLLSSCAEVELELGRKDGNRDCFLRAHNLAQQAADKHQQTWEALLKVRPKSSTGFLGFGKKKSPLEASQITVTVLYHRGKALALLATAQERLGRLDEAQQTLLSALSILDTPLAYAKEAGSQALGLGEGLVPQWVEAAILTLQLVVDLLFALTRVAGGQPSPEAAVAQASALRTRLPGLRDQAAEEPLDSLARKARLELNALQAEINRRKHAGIQEDARSDAAPPPN